MSEVPLYRLAALAGEAHPCGEEPLFQALPRPFLHHVLHRGVCAWNALNHSATKNRRLPWFSRCGQFTRISHIPGGRRPLWREGSYEARPSGSFQPDSPPRPHLDHVSLIRKSPPPPRTTIGPQA